MSSEQSRRPDPDAVEAEVIGALAAAQLPDEIRPVSGLEALPGVTLEQPNLPPLLERALEQKGVSVVDLWVKTIKLEVTVAHLLADLERVENQVQTVDEKRWSEMRMLAALAALVAVAVALVKLLG